MFENVYLRVCYWWEWTVYAGGGGGHGKERGDGKGNPGWGRLMVQPEGHPWDADSHEGWHIDGEHIVGQLKQIQWYELETLCRNSIRLGGTIALQQCMGDGCPEILYKHIYIYYTRRYTYNIQADIHILYKQIYI